MNPPAPPPVQIHHPLCVTVLFKQLSLLKCYSERGGARLLFHLEVSDDGNQTLRVSSQIKSLKHSVDDGKTCLFL